MYFPHFDDGVTPMDKIARGLEDLQRAGKIIHAGLSNFPAWRVADLPSCSYPYDILAEQQKKLGL